MSTFYNRDDRLALTRYSNPDRLQISTCEENGVTRFVQMSKADAVEAARLILREFSEDGDLREACKPNGLRERLDRLERIVSGLRDHMVSAARADFDDRDDPRGRVADWVDAFLGSYLDD